MGLLDRLGLRHRRNDADIEALVTRRVDSVLNAISGLGGRGDKGSAYNNRPDVFRHPLTLEELTALWTHNGIARRIVAWPAAEATRAGWQIDGTGSAEVDLAIFERIREGMTWARLYGAGPVVMVTEDDVPPAFRRRPHEWLAQPLDLERVGKVLALQPYDVWESTPERWDRNPSSPTYRMPLLWRVRTEETNMLVHASRVLHFRGAIRPPGLRRQARYGDNLLPDDSVLQAIWDEIQRLCSTMAGGAVLAQEIRESVLRIGGFEHIAVGDQQGLLESRMRFLAKAKSILGLVLLGPGDEYENRSNPPTGFGELSVEAKSMLCAVTGIPATILFGDAPTGLNTDGASGWQTANRLIAAYQEENRSLIERAYRVVFASQDGPTGGAIPDEVRVEFLPLDELPEREKAETRKLAADADAIYLQWGVVSPEDVARTRFGEEGWNLDLNVDQDSFDQAVSERMQALEAGAPERPDPEAPRADADDPGTVVLVPVAPALWRLARAWVSAELEDEPDPHITVLYLGRGLDDAAVAEVVAEVRAAAAEIDPHTITSAGVVAFPPGPTGVPVVVEIEGWHLIELHERLLRALAHRITAKQWPRFRPHLTLGYAAEVDRSALLMPKDERLIIPVGEVVVMRGTEEVARVALGATEGEG